MSDSSGAANSNSWTVLTAEETVAETLRPVEEGTEHHEDTPSHTATEKPTESRPGEDAVSAEESHSVEPQQATQETQLERGKDHTPVVESHTHEPTHNLPSYPAFDSTSASVAPPSSLLEVPAPTGPDPDTRSQSRSLPGSPAPPISDPDSFSDSYTHISSSPDLEEHPALLLNTEPPEEEGYIQDVHHHYEEGLGQEEEESDLSEVGGKTDSHLEAEVLGEEKGEEEGVSGVRRRGSLLAALERIGRKEEDEFRIPQKREEEETGFSLNKCILGAVILLGLGTIFFSGVFMDLDDEGDYDTRELRETEVVGKQEWLNPEIPLPPPVDVDSTDHLNKLAKEDPQIAVLQAQLLAQKEELKVAQRQAEDGGKERKKREEVEKEHGRLKKEMTSLPVLQKENERMKRELESVPVLQKELETLRATVTELKHSTDKEAAPLLVSASVPPPSGQAGDYSQNTAGTIEGEGKKPGEGEKTEKKKEWKKEKTEQGKEWKEKEEKKDWNKGGKKDWKVEKEWKKGKYDQEKGEEWKGKEKKEWKKKEDKKGEWKKDKSSRGDEGKPWKAREDKIEWKEKGEKKDWKEEKDWKREKPERWSDSKWKGEKEWKKGKDERKGEKEWKGKEEKNLKKGGWDEWKGEKEWKGKEEKNLKKRGWDEWKGEKEWKGKEEKNLKKGGWDEWKGEKEWKGKEEKNLKKGGWDEWKGEKEWKGKEEKNLKKGGWDEWKGEKNGKDDKYLRKGGWNKGKDEWNGEKAWKGKEEKNLMKGGWNKGKDEWKGEKEWKGDKDDYKDRGKGWKERGEKEWKSEKDWTKKDGKKYCSKEWKGKDDRRENEWSDGKKEGWKEERNGGNWNKDRGDDKYEKDHHYSKEGQKEKERGKREKGPPQTHRRAPLEQPDYWSHQRERLQHKPNPQTHCSSVEACAQAEGLLPVTMAEFETLLLGYLAKAERVGVETSKREELSKLAREFFRDGVFVHDQMSFKDFVEDVDDILEDMVKGEEDEEVEVEMDDIEEEAMNRFAVPGGGEREKWKKDSGRGRA